MNEKEVIKRLEKIFPQIFNKEDRQAVKIATAILKRQIPKKPDFEGDGYDDDGYLVYDTWICPHCYKPYEVDYDKYDYCPNCGQALDWSCDD